MYVPIYLRTTYVCKYVAVLSIGFGSISLIQFALAI